MKISPIINTGFKGILDSNRPISGKYSKYTAPATRSTQILGRLYNGAEARGISYLDYTQGLYSTYVKEGEGYSYGASYIPYIEFSDLMNKGRQLKSSARTVLETAEKHENFARGIRKQLLKELSGANINKVVRCDNAFVTTDISTNATTITIPSENGNKLYDVYEFDSVGALDRVLKGVKYL